MVKNIAIIWAGSPGKIIPVHHKIISDTQRIIAKMEAEWKVQTLTEEATRRLDHAFALGMMQVKEEMKDSGIRITTAGAPE